MIKLLIVEDQLVTLEMLTKSLGAYDDIAVVGSITTADMALEACAKLSPDLVLMDILTKSSINGIEATKLIKEQFPKVKVMLITGFDEIRYSKMAMVAKADAFLSKNISVEKLAERMRNVMEGQTFFQDIPSCVKLGPAKACLTMRELEVLRLVCQGQSRTEIAKTLEISNSTINFHINNMLSKTGYHNLITLAMEVVAKGYIIDF